MYVLPVCHIRFAVVCPLLQCWEARLRLERSKAIKCPNVYYHLVGTKKVQQMLAKPDVLERYLDDPKAVTRVRETFAGQYGMEVVSLIGVKSYYM